MKQLSIIFFMLIFPYLLSAQITLWEEGFNSQIDKGVSGDGSGGIVTDLSNVNWTLDYSDCSFAATDDFVKVDAYFSGGRFEARDCNGEAIWESESIDISNYTDVKITVKIGETGSSSNETAKYIKLYSVVDSNEILFATNGEGLGNFGSATASTTVVTGNSLKILIKIRSDFAQDVYFDDIKVVGTPATPTTNDADSEITVVNNPIEDQILTVVSAAQELQEVFKFKITDRGTADGKPTLITRIVLGKTVANTLDWENEILEAVLQAGTTSFTATITSNAFTFAIPKGDIVVADGTSQEFLLKIKTTPSLADGKKFQTQIERVHNFIVDNAGSSLASPLDAVIASGITTFDVKATALGFQTQPSNTAINTNITPEIEVAAIDKNGNIDTDYLVGITLKAPNIGGTTTVSATNGLAIFDKIKFSTATSNVVITASSGTLSSTTSTAFSITELIDETSIIENVGQPQNSVIFPNATAKVFNFSITDKGGDMYPTKVSRLVITPAISNELKWSTFLQKAVLKNDDREVPATVSITDAKITFLFSENNELLIAENSTENLTLDIQLAKNNITEGKVLAFQIAATAHKATASGSKSSKFAPNFPNAIISNAIFTGIEATQLVVISYPKEEVAGSVFSITAQLQDNYGNIDTDNAGIATVEVISGTGTLSQTTEFSPIAVNGYYTWEELNYNRVGTAIFKVQAGSLSSRTFQILFTTAQSSLLIDSNTPLQADTILSSRNTIKRAKDFFKFTVKDVGDDGQPTIVESIQLVKGANFSHSRVYYLLGGVVLKENDKIIGKVQELNTANGYSDITIPLDNPLEVADGESKEITASVFLSTHKKLEDKAQIQLAIEKDYNWEVNASGTGIISPLVNTISSPIFTVEVVASKLIFQDIPPNIIPDSTFSITVVAVNEQGVVDKNYSGTVTLSREAGTGILSSKNGFSLTFANGQAVWTGLRYSKGENFTLLATSSGEFAPAESPYISANDVDSELKVASSQVADGVIASTVADETTAQSIFTFAIQDKGSNDDTPTILTKAVFRNTHPINEADWEANIAGAVLLQNSKPVATTNNILAETITFSNPKGIVTIANGTTENIELAIYLKYNNIQDNKQIQCSVENIDLKTGSTGSALQTSNKSIVSAFTTIDVAATQVDFVEVPYALDTATTTFTVKVAARDTNGNVDIDYNENITLKDVQNIASANFINGVAFFSNLAQNGTMNFTLTAESSNLQSAEQTVFISTISRDLEANFEDNNLLNWSSSTKWNTSILTPISGKYSLKHNLVNAVGTSKIAQTFGTFKLQNATTVWRWQMKNGEWNPSSNNNFYYVLAATSENLTVGTRYVVGVNTSGANDLLTLSKIEDEKIITLLASEMMWKENGMAGIEVKVDSKGKWTLSYDNNGGFDNLYTTGTVTDKPSFFGELFTGFVFNHETASRAGQFWADDILIYHFNTAPEVTELTVLSATQLKIVFSQEMDKIAAELADNYTFSKNISIQKAELTMPNTTNLTVSELQTGTYDLRLKDIYSEAGISLPDTMISFQYFATAKQGEVLLNELMIDEAPSVKLPEYEYIELFNTTDQPFILTNWTISVGKYEKTLPVDTILPEAYVLLCSPSAEEALSMYGKTIAIAAFPALTNTSGTVVLKNAQGSEIDKVAYEKAWYNDKEKENGGWSLERINPKEPSNSRSNWAASQDDRGGTPGAKNSVFGIVLDDTPPILSNVIPISRNKLKIKFNEVVDSLAIKQRQLFFVNGLGYPEQVVISQDAMEIILVFKDNFEYGTIYTIEIKEVIDLFGNALENASAIFGLPELVLPNEIVINEILFNPVSGNVDYVELYNRSSKTFDLTTLFIATRDNKNTLKSVYLLTPDSKLLNPKEFVVLTTSSELVAEQYEVKNSMALLEMKSLPSFPDAEGVVIILNQESTVIDELHYTEKMHLSLLSSKEGVALERVNYELPTQDENNWHSAAATSGFGTPTYQNSAYSELQPVEANIKIEPKVFSPNGDGLDDNMQIHYQFDSPGHIANVSIFDSNGRLISVIARNLTLDTKGIITWEGENSNSERARTGRYLIFIEIFDSNGNVTVYKRSCVLHGNLE